MCVCVRVCVCVCVCFAFPQHPLLAISYIIVMPQIPGVISFFANGQVYRDRTPRSRHVCTLALLPHARRLLCTLSRSLCTCRARCHTGWAPVVCACRVRLAYARQTLSCAVEFSIVANSVVTQIVCLAT